MSTRNNSIRLQRLAKTMDLYSNRSTSVLENTSELVKLPALRAINKSVKYNDLSFATSRDLNKLRKQPDQPDNIEQMSAHHSLVIVRKKYDNMNKSRQQLQRAVDNLQKEHDKLMAEKARFESKKTTGGAQVTNLETSLISIKNLQEEGEIEKKILQSMIDRLKKDKVVYDYRKFNLEKDLIQIHKVKGVILKEDEKQKEEDDRAQKLRNKFLSHLEAEEKERNEHIGSLQGMINQKGDVIKHNDMRKSEMQEVALNTLQDKSQEEKNWEKVLLCHRFVERLLREKMNGQMAKFNVVEVAFKNIKTATGVSNADTLVKKFLSKENTYGDLLGKIADNERIISGLKAEGEQLMKERQGLKAEREHLNSNKIENKDLSRQERELKVMSDKSLKCYTYLQKLNHWLSRNLKRFDRAQQSSNQEQQSLTNAEIIKKFKGYLELLNKNFQEVADFQDKNADLGLTLGQNNCRIKLAEQGSKAQEKVQKVQNTHEEVEKHLHHHYHDVHDHHHIHHHENDQEDYINSQRHEVLRNNQKFMKQLRRKQEELKRELIESQPKKKEVVVVKPKAPQGEAQS